MDDTIIALATAVGEGSIHVLRLSGPQAQEIIERALHLTTLSAGRKKAILPCT